MKKSILLLFVLTAVLAHSQSTYVPDDNFEVYLEENEMGDGILDNDYVLTENINSITELIINQMNISDFTGIEEFIGLKTLKCIGNNTSENELVLDFSNLKSLVYLDASSNNISSITLPNTESLEHIILKFNTIQSVNLNNFPNLFRLNLANNQLSNIDVSNNTLLEHLYLDKNQLSEINLSLNHTLRSLTVAYNELTEINLSNNPQLYFMKISYNHLTELDVSSNPLFTFLTAAYNNLSSIDITNNTLLESLSLIGCNLSEIDISHNPSLENLTLVTNNLTEIDISHLTELYSLSIGRNQLSTLDVSLNTKLKFLNCSENNLLHLDLKNNIVLEHLVCGLNQLSCLNIKNGNNENMIIFKSENNPDLTCIQADNYFLTPSNTMSVDDHTHFDTICECVNTVGIIDLDFINSNIQVYPNPSNGTFNLDMGDSQAQSIQIFNNIGMEVRNFSEMYSNPRLSLDLNPGIYYMNIHLDNGLIATKKLIIQ